jgi:WD40-like Beta Propeller Repeat
MTLQGALWFNGSTMRYLITLLFFLSFGCAKQEIVSARVRVLFDDSALTAYAKRVAQEAETALDSLTVYFGEPKQIITITINDNTDIFNGFASPLPRPKVSIRALFPNDGGLAYGAKSELFFLLIHELTHVSQLSYTVQPEGTFELPNLGLVGQSIARVPPMWFLEGIAVWMESEYTEAGRRDDALTKGLLNTLILSEHFPSLDDISLETYGDWPGGNARYLLGVSFLDFLIDKYDIEVILETLRDFNARLLDGFNASWFRVTQSNLFDEWESWKASLKEKAERVQAQELNLLTDTASYTSSPVFSPDGKRVAWVSMPSKIVVAELSEDHKLVNQKTIIESRFPDTLDWLGENTLIYSRIVRQLGTEFLELFSLDIQSGEETQLTQGARAHMPRAMPDGCIVFVRDLPQEGSSRGAKSPTTDEPQPAGSSLQRFCNGVIEPFWQAPQATHMIGLDISPLGKIALSVWQEGNVDVAILENQHLTFLTQDSFQDLHPVWQDEDKLLFSSDQTGIFELYEFDIKTKSRFALTSSLGGAFQSTVDEQDIIYTTLGSEGYDLAFLHKDFSLVMLTAPTVDLPTNIERPKWGDIKSQPSVDPEPDSSVGKRAINLGVQTYSPSESLNPYGWLPSFGASLSPLGLDAELSALSLDDSNEHSLTLNLGYDTSLNGHLYGAKVNGRYDYRANTVYTSLLPPYPLSFGVQLGIWEHSPHLRSSNETALGLQGYVAATRPLDRWVVRGRLELGLLHLRSYNAFQPDARAEASLSQLSSDDWSYRTKGQRFGVTSVWSATSKGASFGAWADASYYQALRLFEYPGTLELALRAGYKQSPVVSLALSDWAAVGSLGYRLSIPVEWRIDDGVYSLERITLEPRLRPYFDGAFGVAGDLTLSADAVVGYGAAVSFSVSLGYAQGFWYGLGWRLPL